MMTKQKIFKNELTIISLCGGLIFLILMPLVLAFDFNSMLNTTNSTINIITTIQNKDYQSILIMILKSITSYSPVWLLTLSVILWLTSKLAKFVSIVLGIMAIIGFLVMLGWL